MASLNCYVTRSACVLLLASIASELRAQTAPPTHSCVEVDTSIISVVWPGQDSTGDMRRRMDSLERRLAAAPDAEAPRLLLELGRARARFEADSTFARPRPEEFFYNEIGGNWIYQGKHFKELIERFPASDLADDAAYEMTLQPAGGECEGYVACYVHREWYLVGAFLRAYPRSDLAPLGVARALAAFHLITPEMNLLTGAEYVEPAEIYKLVADLDATSAQLPDAIAAPLRARVAELWEQFGEYDRARAAYQAVLSHAPAPLRGCLAPRLAALPTRWFVLDAPRVIHTSRVELGWPAQPGATAYGVHRSDTSATRWTEIARLAATAVGWVDTSVTPGGTFFYRVVAHALDGTTASVVVPVTLPSRRFFFTTAAVSETDRFLHVFGRLDNGFPQLLRINPDGGRVERTAAAFLGDESAASFDFNAYVNDLWLPDGGGIGVLRFTGGPARWPLALRAAARRGLQILEKPDSLRPAPLMIAVKERARAIYVEDPAGSGRVMDCVVEGDRCWIAGNRGAMLRDASGTNLAAVPYPPATTGGSRWPVSIHANPADGSAWLLLHGEARLLHLDQSGRILRDLQIAPAERWHTVRVVGDFPRNALWISRSPASGAPQELVRVDLTSPDLRETVFRSPLGIVDRLVPDLGGGVWVIWRREIARVDAGGRHLFTIKLDDVQ